MTLRDIETDYTVLMAVLPTIAPGELRKTLQDVFGVRFVYHIRARLKKNGYDLTEWDRVGGLDKAQRIADAEARKAQRRAQMNQERLRKTEETKRLKAEQAAQSKQRGLLLAPVHRALIKVLTCTPMPWKGQVWQLRPKHPDLAGVSNHVISHGLTALAKHHIITATSARTNEVTRWTVVCINPESQWKSR